MTGISPAPFKAVFKTTWLKSIIRFLPSSKNIGVFEISPELMLQLIYPLRNVVNYAVTESISMEDLYDFSKKTNRAVSILAEVASAVMSVIFMHSASVGSEQALGTHHAKTTEDFVLATRDNLTNAGGYSSEAVAEETVVKCIPFDTHWEKDKDLRYIERITEIIPIRDRRYPAEKNEGQFSEEDTLEYYKRSTDRRAFTTRNIVEFRNGKYVLANMFTDEMMLEIRSHLSADEEALFLSDMELLKKLSDESEEQ